MGRAESRAASRRPFSLRRSILAWTYVVLLLIVSAQIGRIFLYR